MTHLIRAGSRSSYLPSFQYASSKIDVEISTHSRACSVDVVLRVLLEKWPAFVRAIYINLFRAYRQIFHQHKITLADANIEDDGEVLSSLKWLNGSTMMKIFMNTDSERGEERGRG